MVFWRVSVSTVLVLWEIYILIFVRELKSLEPDITHTFLYSSALCIVMSCVQHVFTSVLDVI